MGSEANKPNVDTWENLDKVQTAGIVLTKLPNEYQVVCKYVCANNKYLKHVKAWKGAFTFLKPTLVWYV